MHRLVGPAINGDKDGADAIGGCVNSSEHADQFVNRCSGLNKSK